MTLLQTLIIIIIIIIVVIVIVITIIPYDPQWGIGPHGKLPWWERNKILARFMAE